MILAAGLGTRLKPLTDTMPKALVPVAGRPLLDIIICRLQAQGYSRFVVNIHHFAQQIRDHVAQQDYATQVVFSDETNQLLETGGALKKAQHMFAADAPILIHNVDILDNVDYEWFSAQHQPDVDALLLVSRRKTSRYLLFDHDMRLVGWTNVDTGEVKSPYRLSNIGSKYTMLAFSGIHSLSPRLFPLMDTFPDRFSIIDFYLSICHRSRIIGLPMDNLRMLDVGKLDTLEQAEKFML